jgi:hypothetical protein
MTSIVVSPSRAKWGAFQKLVNRGILPALSRSFLVHRPFIDHCNIRPFREQLLAQSVPGGSALQLAMPFSPWFAEEKTMHQSLVRVQSGAVATALNLLSDSLSDIELTVSVLSQGDVAVSNDVMRLTGQADRRAEDVSTLARHLIELLRAHRPPAHNQSHNVMEGLFLLPGDIIWRWLSCSRSVFASCT